MNHGKFKISAVIPDSTNWLISSELKSPDLPPKAVLLWRLPPTLKRQPRSPPDDRFRTEISTQIRSKDIQSDSNHPPKSPFQCCSGRKSIINLHVQSPGHTGNYMHNLIITKLRQRGNIATNKKSILYVNIQPEGRLEIL
ncbi:hypothetical protein NPIL_82311 [Nephila pilipes]|uniref:Uncharacterized protein n=1 Tax=Nephila pilipes TaxID=299642 RepID=A0A8X6UT17_NEPPI|nr:hypothetical protein NPIL_82311 [Nephila pilipes]